MAAYAALVSLMNTIHDIINHPEISTFFDNKHTQSLLEKTSSLLDFVEANDYGKEAEDLEREITSVAQAVEEAIDFHIMDQIHAEISLSRSLKQESEEEQGAAVPKTSRTILKEKLNRWITSTPWNCLRGSLDRQQKKFDEFKQKQRSGEEQGAHAETSLRIWIDLQQKIHDMYVVMKKANDFKGKQRSEEDQGASVPVAVMEIEETVMVGLDAELEGLLYELTRDPQSSRKTISIVGMGGTGKTTLAKNIFEIKHHFDFRSWATLSQQHSAQKILEQLLSKSAKKLSSDEKINELGEELHKNLFGRRYLIILDDIWSVKAWDEVGLFFPDNKNGSRIVLTTRLSSVANDCGASLFMMRFLDEDNSWKLFCEKAFKNEMCPPELWEVGEEIVKSCRGLALSIVVMGGLLSKSSRTVEYWKSVVRDIKLISKGSLDILSLSYNHLPAHLKPCFLYMGVFDEDSEILVSEVVRLWIGEGFIKSSGSGVLEEIGEGYIKDMIDRNLILVSRWRKNDKIKGCLIHDLLRDLCIKLGEQQQFFSMVQTSNPTQRRLLLQCADFENDQFPQARCILASSLRGQPSGKRLLRILKIESEVEFANLYENFNLRYLAYKQNIDHGSLWELPTSVSRMWNLQTLIIQGNDYRGVFVAPTEIWKMRKLRHVECENIYLPPYNRQDEDELLILENLQTLKTVVNPRLCMEVIPNIIKLYLSTDEKLYGYDDSLIEYVCNLGCMHKLESLKLDIFFITQKMKPTFPNSLKKLSLFNCGLNWDDVTTIGLLPQLEILILCDNSVVGDRWSPTTGQFLRLKFLELEKIYDLKYWDADDSHFPVLEELLLCLLFGLKEIPLEIGDIPTLELIRVDRCSISAAISAVRIKEDQLDNGNDSLHIRIGERIGEVADFKKRAESEGLSISNIEFELY